MSHTPHERSEEFPDEAEKIQSLRQADPHFARLCDDYHAVNRAVHRAETDLEPTTDDHMAELRKKRLLLKDQIAGRLVKA